MRNGISRRSAQLVTMTPRCHAPGDAPRTMWVDTVFDGESKCQAGIIAPSSVWKTKIKEKKYR